MGAKSSAKMAKNVIFHVLDPKKETKQKFLQHLFFKSPNDYFNQFSMDFAKKLKICIIFVVISNCNFFQK